MKTPIIYSFTNQNFLLRVKIFLINLCFISSGFSALSAQDVVWAHDYTDNFIYSEITTSPKKVEKDLKVVRSAPIFNGGQQFKNIDQFIAAHLGFPKEAVGTGLYGIVKVRFEILKDGDIGAHMILESPGKAFDAAVVDLLGQMPKWTPAYESGEPVTSVYQLKLNFRLQ